jgi:predicted DNA-binding transcriptional regulator YafY
MKVDICEAIQNRRVLRFDYDGGERTVEPYVLGTTRAGVELLRAYQTSGFSQSGQSQGWKLFRTSEIGDIRLAGDTFQSRRDYRGTEPTIINIDCQVEES